MNARPLNSSIGGMIVHHEDQPGISRARHDRTRTRAAPTETRRHHADRIATVEQLGQSLTAISLAAVALRQGGDVGDAVSLIGLAVEEARLELKRLRYDAERDAG
ncbi:hypothetical protein LZ518_02880 [Sphingomonas sp. RB56-2]|uniref:ANTAR domain-containing protein n=1 Tax=Sphingomonas brevis TaxID=2908206 RepID=A0ABT0S6Q8_9SPHN|nr:hypothetical protein [Sphingomonas brevis]MCL6740080.1 hypothetical protein [Sphingomonas brevis]